MAHSREQTRNESVWIGKALIAMAALVLSATPGAAETEFGAFGGATFSTLQRSPEPAATRTESRTGFLVGGVVDLSFGERFGLRFEPAYIEKGTRLIIGSEGGPTTSAETVLGFVEVPVLLRADVIRGRAGLYALGGPAVAFRTSAKGRGPGSGVDADLDRLFESVDFALILGAGVGFDVGSTRLFVEGRYSWGLRNLNALGEAAEVSSSKTRGAQVLAGVSFGRGR